jgi:RNA polymerase sigma factor (sigma-70 family)
MSDHELLREWVTHGSQTAFAQLVDRHIHLVYSTARRRLADPHLAEDITQQVFALLARKASRLDSRIILSGWLYRTTRNLGAETARREQRRHQRERVAAELMNDTTENPWRLIEPWLEEAMETLRPADHDAVVLRYFERKDLKAVGAALGLSDDAAQKRLSRAVEKLRRFFARRGRTLSASAIIGGISVGAVQAAPASLAPAVVAASVAAMGAAGAAYGFAQTMALMKTKLALAAVAPAAVAAPVGLQQHRVNRLKSENRELQNPAAELTAPRAENARLAAVRVQAEELERLRAEHQELLRLRGEVTRLREGAKAGALPAQKEHPRTPASQAIADLTTQEWACANLRAATHNDIKQLCLAARLWAMANQNQLPTTFEQITNELGGVPVDLFQRYRFAQHPRPISETEPQLLLFQEKAPRQRPDGMWEKAYGLCDGSVVTQVSDDGNFQAWEAEHTAQDTPNQ